MAIRRSAAASVSSTLGIAAATLIVAGAIVAWPTVSRCSTEGDGLGACLRDALVDRGLAVPDDEVKAPVVPAGWLDARANEVAPFELPSIELKNRGAGVLADKLAVLPEAAPKVALAPAPAIEPVAPVIATAPVPAAILAPTRAIDVTGSVPAALTDAKVALVGPVGAITASAAADPTPSSPATLLAPKGAGNISVNVATGQADELPAIAVAPLPPAIGTRLAPVAVEPAPVELTAEISPVPVQPEPVAPEPIAPEPPAPEPVAPVPAPIISFDPAYPNVLVLPPPATGENSSIRTWTID